MPRDLCVRNGAEKLNGRLQVMGLNVLLQVVPLRPVAHDVQLQIIPRLNSLLHRPDGVEVALFPGKAPHANELRYRSARGTVRKVVEVPREMDDLYGVGGRPETDGRFFHLLREHNDRLGRTPNGLVGLSPASFTRQLRNVVPVEGDDER